MDVHVISVESYEDVYMLRSCLAGPYGSYFFLSGRKSF